MHKRFVIISDEIYSFYRKGPYNLGVKLRPRRSWWVMYGVHARFIFNSFRKGKILLLSSAWLIFLDAFKNRNYRVNIYIVLWYNWFMYVWFCKLTIGLPTLVTNVPVFKFAFEFLKHFFGIY